MTNAASPQQPLLTIRNLHVAFGPKHKPAPVIEGVDLQVMAGEVLGIVGESGSGKSVTMMALMGLLDDNAHVRADVLDFAGQPLLTISAAQRRRIIGKDIAMIFQDPQAALNPCYTVGFQIMEVLKAHQGLRGSALKQRALELLDLVEIPAAASRLGQYPHQMSGGMSQRVMIAMAIACKPRLLIADEPTTALDVTIQAQILRLLQHLQASSDMALIFISHDLAVVSQIAQRVAVMYAGQVVEQHRVPALFQKPAHPYTQALMRALPEANVAMSPGHRLQALPGMVPTAANRPSACLFAPRCSLAQARCRSERPALLALPGDPVHQLRCYYPEVQP